MARRELPKEWLQIQLGDVVHYGKSQKCSLEDVTDDTWVLELEDIEKESSQIFSRKTAKDRPFKSTKNRFKKGDVLYSKLRPYLNKIVVADSAGVCTTEILPLNAEPYTLNRYLFHWLKTRDFLNYVNEVSYGVNMPRLGTKDGVAAPFILPPLAEQKIIADKLDKLLARVENTKARLDRIPKILKRFRQSVLAAAVSGRLTEEWRTRNGVSIDEWEALTVGDIAAVATGKTPSRKKPEYWEQGQVPWLTSASTGAIYTNSAEQFVTPCAVEECSLRVFPPGTLLLAMYGEGKTRGQVTEIGLSATCNQACAAVIADEQKCLRSYLKLRLLENYEETRKAAAGGAQPNLNLKKVRAISISVPSEEEQTEIINRVAQLFAHADRIEQQIQIALKRVNNLTQGILAKAFRGELTEHWRKDNPELVSGENSATALLERINTERQNFKCKVTAGATRKAPNRTSSIKQSRGDKTSV